MKNALKEEILKLSLAERLNFKDLFMSFGRRPDDMNNSSENSWVRTLPACFRPRAEAR
jgi:hypothetical protein